MMSAMTRRIFVDLNTQNDFCTSFGEHSLGDTNSKLFRNMGYLVQFALSERTFILGSVETNPHDSWKFYTSSKKGPLGAKGTKKPYCVKGELGWNKLSNTLVERRAFLPDLPVSYDLRNRFVYSSNLQALYLEKEGESGIFSNVNSLEVLKDLVAKPMIEMANRTEDLEFVVFGVSLEKDVLNTCMFLKEWYTDTIETYLGKNRDGKLVIKVVEDAVECERLGQKDSAFKMLTEDYGVELVSTYDVTSNEHSRDTNNKTKKYSGNNIPPASLD